MKTVAFQTHLESNVLQLCEIGHLIGKDVLVTITELPHPKKKPEKRKWRYIGAVELNGKLDNVNIRDLAYDDDIDRY